MDKTNRYKSKEKKRAYERALKAAKALTTVILWSPIASLAITGPSDVVAKAIRVIRGRRR